MAKRQNKKRKAGQETPVTLAWKASRGGVASVLCFGTFVNVLKLALPLYLLQVLDRVPASRSIETLVLLTVIVISAIAAGAALDTIRLRMLAHWGTWIERHLGPEVVRRGVFDGTSKDLNTDRLLSDLKKIRLFVTRKLASWFDLIWAPVFLVGTYLVHPYLGYMAIGCVLLLVLLGALQSRMSAESRRASSAAHREAEELVDVASRNRESVGAFGMGESLAARWTETADGRLTERERIEAQAQTFRTILRALSQFLRVGIIALGVWLLLLDQLTLGGIFAARFMAGFGYSIVAAAIRSYRDLVEARRAYVNVRTALDAPAAEHSDVHPNTQSSALRIDNVTHRYAGQRKDLYRKLSLEVAPGEMLLISGGGGVGKSTLSRLIVGLAKPRFGKIFLGDTEIADLPDEERNTLIGFMPQHTEIFAGTVRENIARMDEGTLVDVVAAARMAGIHEFILDLPEGYDTQLLPDTFDHLSGSQRKRIAIARALYSSPRLLVLDEPSANLDSPARRVLEASLRALRDEGSIVVVTQSVRSSQLERMSDKQLELTGNGFTLSSAADARRKPKGKTGLRSVK